MASLVSSIQSACAIRSVFVGRIPRSDSGLARCPCHSSYGHSVPRRGRFSTEPRPLDPGAHVRHPPRGKAEKAQPPDAAHGYNREGHETIHDTRPAQLTTKGSNKSLAPMPRAKRTKMGRSRNDLKRDIYKNTTSPPCPSPPHRQYEPTPLPPRPPHRDCSSSQLPRCPRDEEKILNASATLQSRPQTSQGYVIYTRQQRTDPCQKQDPYWPAKHRNLPDGALYRRRIAQQTGQKREKRPRHVFDVERQQQPYRLPSTIGSARYTLPYITAPRTYTAAVDWQRQAFVTRTARGAMGIEEGVGSGQERSGEHCGRNQDCLPGGRLLISDPVAFTVTGWTDDIQGQ